jgi:serine/threonine-protein kinase RIM15
LITKLLNPDPEQRLGCNGASEIKDHPFFSEINWMNIGDNDFFFVPEIPEVLEEDT